MDFKSVGNKIKMVGLKVQKALNTEKGRRIVQVVTITAAAVDGYLLAKILDLKKESKKIDGEIYFRVARSLKKYHAKVVAHHFRKEVGPTISVRVIPTKTVYGQKDWSVFVNMNDIERENKIKELKAQRKYYNKRDE